MAIALILDLSVLDCHLVYIFHHFPSHEAVALWDQFAYIVAGLGPGWLHVCTSESIRPICGTRNMNCDHTNTFLPHLINLPFHQGGVTALQRYRMLTWR
jgi:hypothetical protein